MWGKIFMTDVVVLVFTMVFICLAEEHYKHRVPDRVKIPGGAVLLLSIIMLPVALVGHIWS